MLRTGHYTRGVLRYRQGRYEQAVRELESLRDGNDLIGRLAKFYHALSQRALGLEALRSGRFGAAEKLLRSAVSVIGTEADLSTHLAGLYAGSGRFDRCADEMHLEIESHPDSVRSHRKYAQALWRQGLRPQAYLAIRSAIRRLGPNAELHIQEGLFLAGEDQYAEARKAFESAVDCDCTSADAHRYLALSAAATGDVVSAARSFQRAFELSPNDIAIAYQLSLAAKAAEAEGYRLVIQLPETHAPTNVSQIRQLASYVVQEPDFVDAFLRLPRSGVDEELFGMLLGIVQMAITDHPRYADLHLHCARILNRMERLDGAVEQAQKAIEINPRYVQALIFLGKIHASTGKTRDAIGYLQRAISSGGDWPDVHCLAAELMGRCGKSSQARKHLERALALNADYPRATSALKALAA